MRVLHAKPMETAPIALVLRFTKMGLSRRKHAWKHIYVAKLESMPLTCKMYEHMLSNVSMVLTTQGQDSADMNVVTVQTAVLMNLLMNLSHVADLAMKMEKLQRNIAFLRANVASMGLFQPHFRR